MRHPAVFAAYHSLPTGGRFLIPGNLSFRPIHKDCFILSPVRRSSLPGKLVEGGVDVYPTRDRVVDYFARYEERCEERPGGARLMCG